jgi:hypothetical protein
MLIKKAYTLEELMLYLEALEMLDMIYTVRKHQKYYDEDSGSNMYNVWVIEYEQGEPLEKSSPIQFED